eukprot:tig00020878_g14868.t1
MPPLAFDAEIGRAYLELVKKSVVDGVLCDPPPADKPEDETDPRWPAHFLSGRAVSMLSAKRLDNVQQLLESCLRDGVPGDFVEAGVWRGGTCIVARAVLKAYGVKDRSVWVADSFEGLPEPTQEVDKVMHSMPAICAAGHLRADEADVRRNFERFGLLDDQVKFLKGWFDRSLPGPIKQLAVLRLDGDYYESTYPVLEALYPLLSPGGYVIVDDWGIADWCAARQATEDYRRKHGIEEPLVEADWHTSYWRKPL